MRSEIAPWTVITEVNNNLLIYCPFNKVLKLKAHHKNHPESLKMLNTCHAIDIPIHEKPKKIYLQADELQCGFILNVCDRHEAYLLCNQLNDSQENIYWKVIKHLPETLNPDMIFILFDYFESKTINYNIEKIVNYAKLLWFGETSEGLTIGPLFNSVNNLEDYLHDSFSWSRFNSISDLGFENSSIPLSLIFHTQTNVKCLAIDIDDLLKNTNQDNVYVISKNKHVLPLFSAYKNKHTISSIKRYQCWDRGLIRDIKIEKIHGAYISTSFTPSSVLSPYFEFNSGKSYNINKAINSLIGESVERFNADVCECYDTIPEDSTYLDSIQFHPSIIDNKKPQKYCKLTDYISKKEVYVNANMIIFPVLKNNPNISSINGTAGLAAQTTKEKAVENAICELLERENFYPNFVVKKRAHRISNGCLHKNYKTLILENNIEFILFYYKDSSLVVPVVHCIVINHEFNIAARGSGSGRNWIEAVEHASSEAMQLYYQQEKFYQDDALVNINVTNDAYKQWRSTEVIEELIQYCNTFILTDISEVKYIENRSLTEIVEVFAENNNNLLLYTFPVKMHGWFVVRLLVTGFTSNDTLNETLGGSKLINRKFNYQIPY